MTLPPLSAAKARAISQLPSQADRAAHAAAHLRTADLTDAQRGLFLVAAKVH